MVKILIGNSNSKIVGHLPDEVQEELYQVLSYFSPGAIFSKKYQTIIKDGPREGERVWDGMFHFYHREKNQSFLTGLLSIVCEILTKHDVEFKKLDRRIVPEKNIPYLEFQAPVGFQDRDYQDFTIARSVQMTRGILKMATGAGKTLVVARLIGEIKTAPFMFYVLTKDLMDQAYDTLSSTLNIPIGRIGGGHFEVKDINVCTIQSVIRSISDDKNFNISDYMFDNEDVWDESDVLDQEKKTVVRRLLANVKGLYLDEAHHASSKICRDIIGASPNAYWRFGGTATPYREDNAEIVLQGLFGKKIVDISASYLIDKGYLLTPYILFDPIKHENVPNSYPSVYSHCVTKNDEFHAHVAKTANHLISRGLSTLILVQHYAHGEALKKLIPNAPFITGKTSTKKRSETIQALRDKKIPCMIATTLADEGLDVPTLDAALLAGGGSSSTRVYQRVGRTLRPDRNAEVSRSKSIVVVYAHDAKHLRKQTQKIKKLLKLEPSFKLKNSMGQDYINGEIDEIMGTGDNRTIFNA